MKLEREILEDTKDKDARWETGLTSSKSGTFVEQPDEVAKKIQEHATQLGSVMEEMLRMAHDHGQSRWGLNE